MHYLVEYVHLSPGYSQVANEQHWLVISQAHILSREAVDGAIVFQRAKRRGSHEDTVAPPRTPFANENLIARLALAVRVRRRKRNLHLAQVSCKLEGGTRRRQRRIHIQRSNAQARTQAKDGLVNREGRGGQQGKARTDLLNSRSNLRNTLAAPPARNSSGWDGRNFLDSI